MVDFGHILLVVDRHVLDVLTFPWLAFQRYKQPSNSATVFDCSALDDVVWSVMGVAHEDLVARTVDTSSDHGVDHVGSVDSEVDAFPVKKKNIERYFLCTIK